MSTRGLFPSLRPLAPATSTQEVTEALDAELSRFLRARTTAAAKAQGDASASSLDGLAKAIRQVRASLSAAASGAVRDEAVSAFVVRAYRWVIRVARELEAITALEVHAIAEWERLEAFAPFALAFYDSAVAVDFAVLDAHPVTRAAVRSVRRDLDAIVALIEVARASSALAA